MTSKESITATVDAAPRDSTDPRELLRLAVLAVMRTVRGWWLGRRWPGS